jgi:hypothetical protein
MTTFEAHKNGIGFLAMNHAVKVFFALPADAKDFKFNSLQVVAVRKCFGVIWGVCCPQVIAIKKWS